MADKNTKSNEVVGNDMSKSDATVYVTVGRMPEQDKTIVGFGKLEKYTDKNGVEQVPGARDFFYKMQEVNNFLKAANADKIPIQLAGQNERGENVYMKADCYYVSGTSKQGLAYGFNKISIELQPEMRNEAGELIQDSQKLYATKRQGGYQFDERSEKELVDKFNSYLSRGTNFTLSATNNKTLDKYPKLKETINQIDKSANVGIDFVKMQGAVIKNITPIDKDGGVGETKQVNSTTKERKGKTTER